MRIVRGTAKTTTRNVVDGEHRALAHDAKITRSLGTQTEWERIGRPLRRRA
jgi:hypothetical protein